MAEGIRPNGQHTSAPTSKNAGALAASQIVSDGPGVLYGVRFTNTNAATRYLQVFDAEALPADAAVPLMSVPVAAGAFVALDFGAHGRAFGVGCVVCTSSTQATKTIGAADALIDTSYKAGA